jgi:hypothetical protein
MLSDSRREFDNVQKFLAILKNLDKEQDKIKNLELMLFCNFSEFRVLIVPVSFMNLTKEELFQ